MIKKSLLLWLLYRLIQPGTAFSGPNTATFRSLHSPHNQAIRAEKKNKFDDEDYEDLVAAAKKHKYTPVLLAFKKRNIKAIRYIIENYPLEIRYAEIDDRGNTVAHWVTALYFTGSDPNGSLLRAVAKIAPYVFEIQNSYGFTPAHFAAEKGAVNIFRIIVKSAPDSLKAEDHLGMTPGLLAAAKSHLNILEFLLSNEAPPFAKKTLARSNSLEGPFGHTAADYLSHQIRTPETLRLIEKLREIEKEQSTCSVM